MGYDLLDGVTVIEVAQFGPDALGGYLADLGARVIKVEAPGGDPLRFAGNYAAGKPDGYGFMHLRWNRGKESVVLDLTTDAGKEDFRKLVGSADVVIEGMRAGSLDKLGLGYQTLRSDNSGLVYCAISGMGRTGPYHKIASHGPTFDAYGGLEMPREDNPTRNGVPLPAPVGMHAMGVYGALGVLAALFKASRKGEGSLIEISAAECSAYWLPETLDVEMNRDTVHIRPGFLDDMGMMRLWARMENYRTRDGKLIFLMTYTQKSWKGFLELIGRPELDEIYQDENDGMADAKVAEALTEVFATRDREDWMQDFRANNVAAMPVNSPADTVRDPHFVERDMTYKTVLPDGQELRMLSSPIRVEGTQFDISTAPDLDQHGDAIAREFGLNRS